MPKEELLSYDCIVCFSGDGTPYEVINGFYQRDDINFENDFITLWQIPVGSACAMVENSSKLPFKKKNNRKNAIYSLCQFKRNKMPLMEIEGLTESGEIKHYYSLINLNYGFIADIDLESEFLRFLGNWRFDVYSFYKVMKPNSYDGTLILPRENCEFPSIGTELDQNNEKFEFFKGRFYSLMSSIHPTITKDSIMMPDLFEIKDKINVQLFQKKEGKWQFLKYLLSVQNFDLEDKKKCIYETRSSFRLILDPRENRKNLMIDGESLSG